MNVNKENIDPNTNSVTVVIETVAETSKEVKRIANKGSREMIGENDLNERDQKKIHTDYIKKGKDLSKLKTYLKEQKEKALKKQITSRMVRRKRVPTKKEREQEVLQKTQDKEKLLESKYQVSCQRELSGKPVRKPKLNFKQNWRNRKNLES